MEQVTLPSGLHTLMFGSECDQNLEKATLPSGFGRHLGGEDFGNRVVDFCMQDFKRKNRGKDLSSFSQRSVHQGCREHRGPNVMRSINEPTAAVIAYGLDKRGSGERNALNSTWKKAPSMWVC